MTDSITNDVQDTMLAIHRCRIVDFRIDALALAEAVRTIVEFWRVGDLTQVHLSKMIDSALIPTVETASRTRAITT